MGGSFEYAQGRQYNGCISFPGKFQINNKFHAAYIHNQAVKKMYEKKRTHYSTHNFYGFFKIHSIT
jgi:hypothetical protein